MKFLHLAELAERKISKAVIFGAVLLFTFILRTHHYDRTPTIGHLEELLYGWSGIYLIETGVPVSWSTLDYPERAEVFRGKVDLNGTDPISYVTLYKPWLDEPPLFSLLVGWVAHLYGADRTDILPTSYIRTPMIFIAALTSIFVFLVARFTGGYWMGILAMLLFGTVPIFVFASRLAVPENVIALFLMIQILLLLKFEKKHKFRYLLPLPILAGVAGLSKPTGYFLIPLAIYFVFAKLYPVEKLRFYAVKACLYLFLATLPFVGLFIAYGNYYDPEIFSMIVSIQGQRPTGFSSLGFLLTTPAFDIFEVVDSWYIFAFLSAGYFIFRSMGYNGKETSDKDLQIQKTKDTLFSAESFILFSFIYWVMIVILSGGEADLLPWYRFPAFPLLAIISAWGLKVLVEKANIYTTFLAAGLLLGNRFLLVNPFRPNLGSLEHRLIFSMLMLVPVINSIFYKKFLMFLNKLIIIGVIIVGLIINSWYIYKSFEIACENRFCPIGPSTALSSFGIGTMLKLFSK